MESNIDQKTQLTDLFLLPTICVVFTARLAVVTSQERSNLPYPGCEWNNNPQQIYQRANVKNTLEFRHKIKPTLITLTVLDESRGADLPRPKFLIRRRFELSGWEPLVQLKFKPKHMHTYTGILQSWPKNRIFLSW